MIRSTNQPPARFSRRQFLYASAVSLLTVALSDHRVLASGVGQQQPTDIDLLNYALVLEHLESRFYRDINNIQLLTGRARDIFLQFGEQEAVHVVALTGAITALGGTPVRAQAQYNLPEFRNEQEVLEFFKLTEELGAAAYLGAAPLIQDKALLTTAVSIHNVEGQHAAILSELAGLPAVPAFAEAKTMEQILAAIQPFLSTAPTAMPQTGRGGRAQRRCSVRSPRSGKS